MKKKHFGDGYTCDVRVFYDVYFYDPPRCFHSIRAALRYLKKYHPGTRWIIHSRYTGIPNIRNF